MIFCFTVGLGSGFSLRLSFNNVRLVAVDGVTGAETGMDPVYGVYIETVASSNLLSLREDGQRMQA